ncbi:MAG TPA: hypothetical protein VHV74_06925 [Pseudonocardiaceae bacterium]|jgi:hypothetical protein|nr:hypothetical protein [Pseudonocardiaceae bacterium]
MERRRLAVVLAGIVLVGGAIVALRVANDEPGASATPPAPPVPTSLRSFSAEGVLAPVHGAKPARPKAVVLTQGPRRLQVAWGAAVPGGVTPKGAAGYDVGWVVGSSDHDMLVAQPYAELDDLPPGQAVRVSVRTVDAFGQRSAPLTAVAHALPDPPAGADNALVDDFTGPRVPDPARWQIATSDNCAQAGGADGRLQILTQCGQSPVTLRSRAPLRLRSQASGELGRFTIDTDAPGESGELDIDLVPGPVTMIDGSPNDPLISTKPDVAAIDPNLPPDTIRVRIAATVDSDSGVPGDTVQVTAGQGTPVAPAVNRQDQALPRPQDGISVRWDVVLRNDGIVVLRNGVAVGGGNVVPKWTEATPLVEFSGPSLAQQNEDVNMIGMGGAPTKATPLVAGPALSLGAFPIVTPGSANKAIVSTDTGPGSALLRLTVLASPNDPSAQVTINGAAPKFSVQLGGKTYAASVAVPGTKLLSQVRYPLVARIPAGPLAAAGAGPLPLVVVLDAPHDYPAQLSVLSADLDIVPGDKADHTPTDAATPSLSAQPPQLAGLSAQILDASGNPPPQGKPFPRGRGVLAVTMDGVATQRTTGELAGLAGIEVWLDNKELVTVPTAVDGPGIDGTWQISINTAAQAAGAHMLDIRAFGTAHGVPFGETFVSYQLGK